MQQPDVRTSLHDPNTEVTYHVIAYRTLSRQELLQSVATYLSKNKRKRPKPGSSVTIITIIGVNDK